jgi:dethiobiotin synthetase
LVPLNDNDYVLDLIKHFDCEVVLVSRNYLGSINHTLLSIEALKSRGIKIAGIIFNGERNKSTEEIILKKHDFPFVGYVNQEENFTKEIISSYSLQFNKI